MFILRLESETCQGVFGLEDIYEYINHNGDKKNPHDMPSPFRERKINEKFSRDYYCGFSSWEQMNVYFFAHMRKWFQKHGKSKLAVYKVPKCHTISGDAQIVFIKEKAKLVYRGNPALTKKQLESRVNKLLKNEVEF